MSKQKKLQIILVFLIIFVFLFAYLNLFKNHVVGEKVGLLDYYVISSILAVISILFFKLWGLKILFPLFIITGTFFAWVQPIFSPIDEGAHFDYIKYVENTGQVPNIKSTMDTSALLTYTDFAIPSGIRYEGFHPPVYYYLSAIVTRIVPGNTTKDILAVRFLGVIAILLSIFFILKSYKLLHENKIIKQNDFLFFSVLMLLAFTPGFMYRMTSISNESLAVALCTIVTYLTLKIFLQKDFKTKTIIIIAVVLGIATLVKVTSILFIIPIGLLILFNKKYKEVLIFGVIILVITAPWILQNYHRYRSVIATKEHLDFVKPILNPTDKQTTVSELLGYTSVFLGIYFNPQEVGYANLTEPNTLTSDFTEILVVLAVLSSFYFLYQAYKKQHYKFFVTGSLLVSTIVLVTGFLIFNTLSLSINWMLGRYLYICIFPLIFCLYIFIQRVIKSKYKIFFASVLIFIAVFLLVNSIFQYAGAYKRLLGLI
jgi:hypothetical protein